MRLTALLLLPLLVAADQQPMKDKASGWFDKAKAYMDTGASAAVDAAAETVAEGGVEIITRQNWEQKLAPNWAGEQEWLLYITGGNKSCYGRCARADEAWNVGKQSPPSKPRI